MCMRIRLRYEIRRKLAIQTEAMNLATGLFRYKSDRNVLDTSNNMDYELDGLSDVILALYDSLERR